MFALLTTRWLNCCIDHRAVQTLAQLRFLCESVVTNCFCFFEFANLVFYETHYILLLKDNGRNNRIERGVVHAYGLISSLKSIQAFLTGLN